MKTTFKIDLPEHLVIFAAKKYWEGKEPPFFVDERGLIGKQIMCYLLDKRLPPPTKEFENSSYLELELSRTLAKRSPTQNKLSRLHRFLEEEFKLEIISWTKALMLAGYNRYRSLETVLNYYSILGDGYKNRYYQFLKQYDLHQFELDKKRMANRNQLIG